MKKRRSKYGEDGRWDLKKVLAEAAKLVYEYYKEDFEPGKGRRVASMIRKGRLWELDGDEAWAAWDALKLKREPPLDPALVPIVEWLDILMDLRRIARA